MRKTSLILLSAAAGAAATLLVTQPRASLMGTSARAAAADTYRQLNLFGDVFDRVRSDYVEKPDDKKLIESAISGMLTGLDPHSSYMDAKSFKDMQVQTRGEFGGLGIEVTMEDGLIKVVSPIDDTPASKAGILANDIITNLDDEAVQGLTLNQAVLHRDLDAEPAEFAAGLHLHVLEALRIHVAGVRVEAGQHAADGALDQLLVVGLLDIVAADAVEHVAEQIELAIGVGGGGTGRATHQRGPGLGYQKGRGSAGCGAEKNE